MPRRRHPRHDAERETRAAHFAAALADALHALGLTHSAVARELSVSRYAVDSWTRASGPNLPSDENLEKLTYLLEGRQPGLGRRLAAIASGAPVSQAARRAPESRLPAFATSFIGREGEVVEVREALGYSRLVTLTGPGGIGKTRLALRVASETIFQFPDGVFLVELADLTNPALVLPAVAVALGVQTPITARLLASVTRSLSAQDALLVLDNCEHLLQACAELVAHLLAECASLRVLATSRESLGVGGETVWRVPPLTLPQSEQIALDQLSKYEATRLFIERAFLHQARLSLSPANAAAVVHICRRLDGIPLAIELAAAAAREMPVEQIAERLDDRFQLLTHGGQTVMSRHQTLRAALEWSYNLLSPVEQALFRRLGVFVGGWTTEAAEAVVSAQLAVNSERLAVHSERFTAKGEHCSLFTAHCLLATDIRDLLSRLVDKSLVTGDERDGATRYRMLETIREYALMQVEEAGETAPTRQRHLAYFLRLAEANERRLRGEGQAKALSCLDAEYDNLRAALEWAFAQVDAAALEQGIRLVVALWWFWILRDHLAECETWFARAEESVKRITVSAELRARFVYRQAYLERGLGRVERGRAWAQEALELCRALGDGEGEAIARLTLARCKHRQGDWAGAREDFAASLALFRAMGSTWGIGFGLMLFAEAALEHGELDRAEGMAQESMSVRRALGNPAGIAPSLGLLARIAYLRGDYAGARALLLESLAIARQVSYRWVEANALKDLAQIALAEEQWEEGLRLGRESLEICRRVGRHDALPEVLHALGVCALRLGDLLPAEQWLNESLARARELDDRGTVSKTRAALGELARVNES